MDVAKAAPDRLGSHKGRFRGKRIRKKAFPDRGMCPRGPRRGLGEESGTLFGHFGERAAVRSSAKGNNSLKAKRTSSGGLGDGYVVAKAVTA